MSRYFREAVVSAHIISSSIKHGPPGPAYANPATQIMFAVGIIIGIFIGANLGVITFAIFTGNEYDRNVTDIEDVSTHG